MAARIKLRETRTAMMAAQGRANIDSITPRGGSLQEFLRLCNEQDPKTAHLLEVAFDRHFEMERS